MDNKKLTKQEIVDTLNRFKFLDIEHYWEYSDLDKAIIGHDYKVVHFMQLPIARAIAKAYLRLEAKQAKSKRKNIEGIDQGEKVLIIDDNQPIKTIISNKLGNSPIEISIAGNPDQATVAKTISENSSFTAKEAAEGLRAILNSANQNSGEGVRQWFVLKCNSIQHIVHSGYPLVPETLICMLNANHKSQHCATDQKGNRINWS